MKITNSTITRLQTTLSQRGLTKVSVVEAGKLTGLNNIVSLHKASSDAVRNIARNLTDYLGQRLGITVIDILCDLPGKLAISMSCPEFLDKVKSAKGNLGVLGHTVVIEMETEESGKVYFLKDPANIKRLKSASPKDISRPAIEAKPKTSRGKNQRVFTLEYPNDSSLSASQVLAASKSSSDQFTVRKSGDASIAIIDPETDKELFSLDRETFCFDFPMEAPPVWSRDGQFFASSKNVPVGTGGAMQVIDVKSKKPVFELINISPGGGFAWRKKDNYLAIGDQGAVYIVDIAKRKIIRKLNENNGILYSSLSIAWSSNDRYLGVSCGQGKILIFDMATLDPGERPALRNEPNKLIGEPTVAYSLLEKLAPICKKYPGTLGMRAINIKTGLSQLRNALKGKKAEFEIDEISDSIIRLISFSRGDLGNIFLAQGRKGTRYYKLLSDLQDAIKAYKQNGLAQSISRKKNPPEALLDPGAMK